MKKSNKKYKEASYDNLTIKITIRLPKQQKTDLKHNDLFCDTAPKL
jgi:hypothetical protein